jgi:hypothetical protein
MVVGQFFATGDEDAANGMVFLSGGTQTIPMETKVRVSGRELGGINIFESDFTKDHDKVTGTRSSTEAGEGLVRGVIFLSQAEDGEDMVADLCLQEKKVLADGGHIAQSGDRALEVVEQAIAKNDVEHAKRGEHVRLNVAGGGVEAGIEFTEAVDIGLAAIGAGDVATTIDKVL